MDKEYETDDGGLVPPPTNTFGRELSQVSSHASRNRGLYPTRSYIDSHGVQSDQHNHDPEQSDSAPEKEDSGMNEKFKEVTWDGDDDLMNPKNKPRWKVNQEFASLLIDQDG